jgi:hypothetical protein
MKLRETEELSDLVWIGRRMDIVLKFLRDNQSSFEQEFIELADEYFVPLIVEYNDIELEDILLSEMDAIIDEFDDMFPDLNTDI